MKRATAVVLATTLAMTMAAAPAYSDDGRVKCWKFWKKAFWTSGDKC